MRTEITYYAFDDTEFSSEEECLAYEGKIKKNMGGVRFFNEHFVPILIDCLDAAEKFGDAIYILVTDASKAYGFMNWLTDYTGIDAPQPTHWRDNDVWYYDEDLYEWVNLTERVEMLSGLLKEFKEKANEYT